MNDGQAIKSEKTETNKAAIIDRHSRAGILMYCFDSCVQSFRLKHLDEKEHDCMTTCIDNQAAIRIELNNAKRMMAVFRDTETKYYVYM